MVAPSLRAEAFQASKLDAQLDAQGRLFLADKSKNRLDAKNKTLYLSPIFDWFEDDFTTESGTVQKFVAQSSTTTVKLVRKVSPQSFLKQRDLIHSVPQVSQVLAVTAHTNSPLSTLVSTQLSGV